MESDVVLISMGNKSNNMLKFDSKILLENLQALTTAEIGIGLGKEERSIYSFTHGI